VIDRVVAGALLAAGIAGAGWHAHALTGRGAAAAAVIGTLAVAAGWNTGILLILYFVAATILTRAGAARKAQRVADIVAKGGRRDARQVIANGGAFAAAAAGALLWPHPVWMVAAAGALAASTADTWGTELGTLADGTPRLVTSWRPVPAGTSGAVSVPGLLATVAGAAFIATATISLGWTPADGAAVAGGGIAGALADSLLGATVQERRHCPSCNADTERPVHSCGAATRHAGGLAGLENDAVNLLSSTVGALVAAALVL
jgi:uncharacterized protein (TIGR00297 family)